MNIFLNLHRCCLDSQEPGELLYSANDYSQEITFDESIELEPGSYFVIAHFINMNNLDLDWVFRSSKSVESFSLSFHICPFPIALKSLQSIFLIYGKVDHRVEDQVSVYTWHGEKNIFVMVDNLKSDWNNSTSSSQQQKECTICGAPSNGYHFNAASCSACAAFFRRTVTLNRNFVCSHQNLCRVNYAMRVICRACRYQKCLSMGMERSAVQPRRDCNAGRRKIMYNNNMKALSPPPPQTTVIQGSTVIFKDEQIYEESSPEVHYAQSYSSSISEEITLSPKISVDMSLQFEAEQVLEDLLREERLFNERRKLLYCSNNSISNLITNENSNEIPYSLSDLQPLTFAGIQKHIRPQILVIYEWLRGWRHFELLNTRDRMIFLRRCVLYHTILDPSYLSYRLGLPEKFVMFNGMYVGAQAGNKTGWEDENDCISSDLKIKLYRPLMERLVNEVCVSMKAINLSFTEFVLLKALVSFKSSTCCDVSEPLKKFMNSYMDSILRALNIHYQSLGMSKDEIAQRIGNVILMMSSIFAVGMECLESHQKIQFFDLWQLDDLLIKLIQRGGGAANY
ncbi:Protein CBR-NHR-121 [Caenorhabditis briggsae]|uniref:Protein CBR-NHR-121 n=1 Tax=Caenorhabditis briggsae TaxID=6238 RepID=A8XMI5_CAEBR|nr:Protein CBR-NHR-121 [Caenorhabditis briggsae]CAP33861.2 Protein CBR-NHR-121 [Caenorhabditis briggsae]